MSQDVSRVTEVAIICELRALSVHEVYEVGEGSLLASVCGKCQVQVAMLGCEKSHLVCLADKPILQYFHMIDGAAMAAAMSPYCSLGRDSEAINRPVIHVKQLTFYTSSLIFYQA